MSLFLDRGTLEWRILESIQPLFAADLPWQPCKSSDDEDATAAAILFDTSVKLFQHEMRILLDNRPSNGISDQGFQSCYDTLSDLLEFLQSLVRDHVYNATSNRNADETTIHINAQQSPTIVHYYDKPAVRQEEPSSNLVLSWLTALPLPSWLYPTSDNSQTPINPIQSPSLSTTNAARLSSKIELKSYGKLQALGEIIERVVAKDGDLLRECCHFLKLELLPAVIVDAKYKATCLNRCMESLQEVRRAKRTRLPVRKSIPKTQWENRKPWDLSRHLFGILNRRFESCPKHQAMLQLNGFKLEGQNGSIIFDLFFSSCRAPYYWQEGRCTSMPSGSIAHEGVLFVSDLCRLIEETYNTQEEYNVVNVQFDQRYLWHNPSNPKQSASVGASPALSLQSLLQQGYLHELSADGAFSVGDKAVLALSLSRCILHLFQGSWMQRPWKADAIQFRQSHTGDEVLDIHHPYIACSLSKFKAVDSPNLNPVDCQYILLMFAHLLLEIETGEETKLELGSMSTPDDLDQALYEVLEDRSGVFARAHYNEAVEGCLKFKASLTRERRSNPGTDMEYLVRKVIYRDIIANLEKNIALFPDPSSVFGIRNLHVQDRFVESVQSTTNNSTQECGHAEPRSTNEETTVHQMDQKILAILEPIQGIESTSRGYDVNRSEVAILHATRPVEILFNDYEEVNPSENNQEASWAERFWDDMRIFNQNHLPKISPNSVSLHGSPDRQVGRIRICIIDTGVCLSDPIVARQKRRITGRSWVNSDPNHYEDMCGHGTHVVRSILKTTSAADLLVAKVSEDKTFNERNEHFVAEAIRWAIREKADIISLSLGFREISTEVKEALDEAIFPTDDQAHPKLVFAAAANWGLNHPRAFPANEPGVFCIYASDGNGNPGRINPQFEGENSFATLGVAIDSFWKQKIRLSGTSFATPIAAGIAANILEFARCKMNLGEHRWRQLASYQGMRSVFRLMSTKGQQFLYISPMQLNVKGYKTDEAISNAIMKAIILGVS